MLVFLGSTPISWLSLKQKVVALSTCEAEYVAAATAACQVVWLRRLLGELTGVEAHPTALMVDNQPAIALAKMGARQHYRVLGETVKCASRLSRCTARSARMVH